jgi:hypothetical protein
MTLPPFVRSWWFVPAIALVVVALLVSAWDGKRNAAALAERRAEAAELAAKGITVAREASERELKARLAAAKGLSTDLAGEVARLEAASPGARPVAVFSGSTGALPAAPQPKPPAVTSASEPASATVCLFRSTDKGSIFLSGTTMETQAGNRVMLAVAEAYRVEPEPRIKLFGGPLKLDISVAAPPRSLGWGVGLMASASRSGWAVGPMLSPPPWVVLGVQLEALAAAGIGPTGDWAATAAILARKK